MNHKILILLLYWNRPELVRNALRSVLNSTYENWHLAFIDDSSINPGQPVVEEILADHLGQVTFYNTETPPEVKLATGGFVGKFMNDAIQESDAELAIILCDDDELHPDYLTGLNKYFSEFPGPVCYSHVHVYNPLFERSEEVHNLNTPLNKTSPIKLWCQIDASQVAWRTDINRWGSVWFRYPQTKCLDSDFFQDIDNKFGETPFSGLVAQYKATHSAIATDQEVADIWKKGPLTVDQMRKMTDPQQICPIILRYYMGGQTNIARRICEEAISCHPYDAHLYLWLRKLSDV